MTMPQLDHRCPICDSPSEFVMPILNWGEALECTGCGFVFANPMERAVPIKELFSQVYAGKVPRGELPHFAQRIRHRKALSKVRRLVRSTHLALNWLRDTLPPGSTVLDIGCGPGYLLGELRSHGYNAIGVEPAELPVSILRREGFQVWNGTIEDYPLSWPEPNAVTCFNMLHHLANPLQFFCYIRARFPQAPLLIAFGGGSACAADSVSSKRIGLSPPRNLSEWTRQALEQALSKAGYQATVSELPSTAGDLAAGAIESFYLSSGNILNYFLWLFMGQSLNDSIQDRIAHFPSNFRQRLQRLTGLPCLIWAVAQPAASDTMKRVESQKAGARY